MLKKIFKLLLWVIGILAVLLGAAYWADSKTPEYVSIYSDDDDSLF